MSSNPRGTGKIPDFAANILKKMWIDCSNKVSTALSEMINAEVKVVQPSMRILPLNELPELLNPKDITATVIYTQLLGDIRGVIIISSSLKDILKMADMLLHKEIGYYKDLSDENMSVVKELGAILAGYYITDLDKLFETAYEGTPPSLSINPYRAIEDFGFGNVYREEVYALALKAKFSIKKERIRGDILLLFRKEDVERILGLVSEKIKLAI